MRHAWSAVVVLAVISAQARAQNANTSARAEQLFKQARDLAKADHWAEACPLFEASLRNDAQLGTQINLAICYERVGKLASAWAVYRDVAELATKAGDKRAAYAQKQAAALELRLPKLAISTAASRPAGYTVQRDDIALDIGELGVALYVDPGIHTVIASAPGFESRTLAVTLVEGKTETLVIPALTATPVSRPVAVPSAPTTAPITSRVRAYTAYGLGAAGLVTASVGFVFGTRARSRSSDAATLCPDRTCTTSDALIADEHLLSDARSNATSSTVLVAAGGVAIAAGVIVLLTSSRGGEPRAAQLVPVTARGGAGLALAGAF